MSFSITLNVCLSLSSFWFFCAPGDTSQALKVSLSRQALRSPQEVVASFHGRWPPFCSLFFYFLLFELCDWAQNSTWREVCILLHNGVQPRSGLKNKIWTPCVRQQSQTGSVLLWKVSNDEVRGFQNLTRKKYTKARWCVSMEVGRTEPCWAENARDESA